MFGPRPKQPGPRVPFLDAGETWRELREELDEAGRRVLERGWYILGEEVSAFESEFAAFCGTRCCAGTGNGPDALVLTLRGYEIGPGDEVLVPAHTFVATWLAVLQTGARAVGVDVLPGTANINPDCLQAAITPRTRAAMPVRLYGQPARMEYNSRDCRTARINGQ